jgi:hypothetical protein
MGANALEKANPQEGKPADNTAGTSGLKSGGAKWLLVFATIYAFWLAWLLYVGVVNYRAGNQ